MSTDAATAVLVALRAHAQGLHEAVETAYTDAPGTAVVLRDAAARTAALLDSYREILDPARTGPVAVDLRRLAAVAGRVRDAEALQALLAELLTEVPRALVVGPVADRVRHHLRDRRTRAGDALAKAVRDEACVSALASVDRIVITPPLLAPRAPGPAVVTARVVDERPAVWRGGDATPRNGEAEGRTETGSRTGAGGGKDEGKAGAEKAGDGDEKATRKAEKAERKEKDAERKAEKAEVKRLAAAQDKGKDKAERKAAKAERKAERARDEARAERKVERAEDAAPADGAGDESAGDEPTVPDDAAAPVLARAAGGDDARLMGMAAALRDAGGEGGRERVWPDVREAAMALSGSAGAARSEHGKKARHLAEAADTVAARTDEVVDTILARRLLVDLADQAHRRREPGFTYGLLHAEAAHRGSVANDRASDALEELGRDKLRSWLPAS